MKCAQWAFKCTLCATSSSAQLFYVWYFFPRTLDYIKLAWPNSVAALQKAWRKRRKGEQFGCHVLCFNRIWNWNTNICRKCWATRHLFFYLLHFGGLDGILDIWNSRRVEETCKAAVRLVLSNQIFWPSYEQYWEVQQATIVHHTQKDAAINRQCVLSVAHLWNGLFRLHARACSTSGEAFARRNARKGLSVFLQWSCAALLSLVGSDETQTYLSAKRKAAEKEVGSRGNALFKFDGNADT